MGRTTLYCFCISTYYSKYCNNVCNNSYFGTINLVYVQSDQTDSNVTNSLIIHNIPVKNVHVGDIDIAYNNSLIW